MDKHHTLMEGQTNQTEQMKREIANKKKDNTETIKQIEQDAEFEKDDMQNKNRKNMK